MEGVFFDEEVHNIKKGFNIALAKAIQAEGLNTLKFEAMCEYASLDQEALKEMHKAGYYKIRFGIETGSDLVAEKMTLGKKHDLHKMRKILKFGKSLGMVFYGTFTFGGLGSSEEEDQKTADLIHELTSQGLLDEIQVSINTPQPGTDFYNTAVKNSSLRPISDWADFDGNGHVMVDYPHYKERQIQSMRQKALSAFDRGREAFMATPFTQALGMSFEQIPRGAKALVLRSVRQWMIILILETLSRRRGIKADLLGQDTVLGELRNNPHSNQVYSYGDGFFAADSISTDLFNQLRDGQYDYVFVPMANNHLQGYQNVIEVAHMIHPKNLVGIYPDGKTQNLESFATPATAKT